MKQKPRTTNFRPRSDAKKLVRITGMPAVSALFAAQPERVEKLFFDNKAKNQVGVFCSILAKARKLYKLAEPDEMERVAGTILHGGVIALATPQPVLDFDPQQATQWAKENKILLLLDGVSNPHNFGAIARTAAFFGLPRIVVSDHLGQALPSDASYRIAEGGLEHIQLYRATQFAHKLKKLSQSYHIIGTAAEGKKTLGDLKKSDKPFALVLGNEENGMPSETLKMCDDIVTIAGAGAVQSLNVSVSAGILIYALSSL